MAGNVRTNTQRTPYSEGTTEQKEAFDSAISSLIEARFPSANRQRAVSRFHAFLNQNTRKDKLKALCDSHRSKSKMFIRMLVEVYQRDRKDVDRLLLKLSNYRHSLPMLESFLNHMGTHDPFFAADKVEVQYFSKGDVPAHIKEKLPRVKEGDVESARGKALAKSASGARLRKGVFIAVNPERPEKVGFVCGEQGMLGIMSTFGINQAAQGASGREVEKGESDRLDKALKGFEYTADILGEEPKPSGYTVLEDLEEALAGMRAMLRDKKAVLDAILIDGTFSLPEHLQVVVADPQTGAFWNLIKRDIEEGQVLDSSVIAAFNALRQTDYELPPEVETLCMTTLLVYVSERAALASIESTYGLLQDVTEFEDLSKEDSIRLELEARYPELGTEVFRTLLASSISSAGESFKSKSVSEWIKLFRSFPLTDFRRLMATRTLNGCRVSSITELTSLFKDIYLHADDSPRSTEDKSGGIKDHYARHAVAAKNKDGRSSVSLNELSGSVRMLLVIRIVGGDDGRAYAVRSVEDFRKLVRAAVTVNIKADFLENQLVEMGMSLASPASEVNGKNFKVLGPLVDWQALKQEAGLELDNQEFLSRLDDYYRRGDYPIFQSAIRDAIQRGFFPKFLVPELADWVERVSALVPRTEHELREADIEDAKAFVSGPFFEGKYLPPGHEELFKRKYWSSVDVRVADEVLRLARVYQQEDVEVFLEDRELVSKLEAMLKQEFIRGEVTSDRRLMCKRVQFRSLNLAEGEYVAPQTLLVERARETIDLVETDFVAPDEVTDEVLKLLPRFAPWKSKRSPIRMTRNEVESCHILRDASDKKSTEMRISKELLREAVGLRADWVGDTPKLVEQDGEILFTSYGSRKNISIWDMPDRTLGFLAQNRENRHQAHVQSIARIALNAKSDGLDKGEFLRMVRKRYPRVVLKALKHGDF